ncbi:MAG: tRNA (adenosine(37)-N6)-dimethylallyltransferase MiaA, partial [Patescibacteria group bacterium]|nr:tRNA (adenosine(37)-N6)-dimethylallyltransferase MiaA [Patescibacteria group bacterium]
ACLPVGKACLAGRQAINYGRRSYMVEKVPHYLMDIIEPDEDFSLADFKKMALKSIKDILKRGKTPFVVGGTGLYIWSIVDNLDIPKVKPDNKLRQRLEKKTLRELVEILKKEDKEAAAKIDLNNPRRVIRALEVVLSTGKPFFSQRTKSNQLFDVLQIGVSLPMEKLYERINKRVEIMIKQGLLEEIKNLTEKFKKHKNFWNLPSVSGIGYRQIGSYLRGEASLDEAIEQIKKDTRHYAKRQMTWFKRDKRVKWIKNKTEAEKLIKNFLLQ